MTLKPFVSFNSWKVDRNSEIAASRFVMLFSPLCFLILFVFVQCQAVCNVKPRADRRDIILEIMKLFPV